MWGSTRRVIVTVAAAMSVTLVLISGSGSAASVPRASTAEVVGAVGVGEPADYRAQLTTLLVELDASVGAMEQDPALAASLDTSGGDLRASIGDAIDLVGEMSPDDLATMEEILDTVPALEALPGAIDGAVAADAGPNSLVRPGAAGLSRSEVLRTAAWGPPTATAAPSRSATVGGATSLVVAPMTTGTYTDNCASAGDPEALGIATLVANQVQSAAYAVVIAVPSAFGIFVGISAVNPAKIVVAIIYGIALAVYLALAQTWAVAQDCAGSATSTEFESTYPVAPPGSVDPAAGTVVQGSSQISVNLALLSAGGVADLVADIGVAVDDVGVRLEQIADAAAALNTTLSCTTGFEPPPAPPPPVLPISPGAASESPCPVAGVDAVTRVTGVNDDAQELQSNVTVLINTEQIILDKADDEIEALAAFEALQLRMEIEANLGDSGFQPVGSFMLPPPLGYLDVVREIVEETVAAYGAPTRDLDLANQSFTAGRYKQAYSSYQKAYQGAVR